MFMLGFADSSNARPDRPGRDSASAKPPKDPNRNPNDPNQEDDDEELVVAAEVNAVVVDIMPWAISILLHAAVVLLAVFIVWSVIKAPDEEIIIPDARLSNTPGAPVTVMTEKKVTQPSSARRSPTKTQTQTTSNLTSTVNAQSQLIGVAGGAPSSGSPFGTGLAAGTGTAASFYGTGGNARRIAYIVDASGSLMDSLPFVVDELKRSIGELSDAQSFTVIFFQADRSLEVPPAGLKTANSETKRRVNEWIDLASGNVVPRQKTNPIPAMQLALRYKPQLMFLLSDNITGSGKYEIEQSHLIQQINNANAAKTKINTIQFLYEDPLSQQGLKPTLQQIAEDTGGIYKFVTHRELGLHY